LWVRLVWSRPLSQPAEASTGGSQFFGFRTPGDIAYCQMGFPEQSGFRTLRCWRPTDGSWIRLAGFQNNVRASKGCSSIYRGYHNDRVPLLPFGRKWATGDVATFTCWNRITGLTCKHIDGLTIWLGCSKGYRIYYDAPGFRPHVRPLFRTGHGIYCGIDLDNLAPEVPSLLCWQPSTALELGVGHNASAGWSSRQEKAKGFRPRGFRVQPYGATFSWLCTDVSGSFAEHCSTTHGTAVFYLPKRACARHVQEHRRARVLGQQD